MPMYARLWVDILDDPKLMAAVDDGARHLDLLPWLIVFAKRADANGRLEIAGKSANPRQIARSIPNTNARSVAKCEEELAKIGILTQDPDGCYRFVAWEYRNSGKASDSKEAVAERVARHRARKRGDKVPHPVTDGNAGNALHVTDVTSKRVESREEREESREKRVKAGSSEKDSLPAGALEFGRTFYRSAPRARRLEVKQQLLATLNGGAKLRRGVKVRAQSPEHLDRRCREVMAEGVKDPDKAIVVLLTKLADVGNAQDSPTEKASAAEKRAEKRDEAEAAQRLAHATAWLADNPDVAAAIAKSIDPEIPEGPMRRILENAAVLKAWTDAGEPIPQPAGSP